MDQPLPRRVVIGRQFRDGAAQHGRPVLIEDRFVGLDVPLPSSQARAFENETEALLVLLVCAGRGELVQCEGRSPATSLNRSCSSASLA